MGASVQFVGNKAVLKAFEKVNYSKWSLWLTSKDMLASFDGSDMTDSTRELEEWLEMIRSNTTGIFTLKFYNKSTKEIKPGTPHDYAFNFRLTTEDEQRTIAGVGSASIERAMEKLLDRMDKADKRIEEMEKDDGEEPIKPWERALENPVIMAGIGKLLNLDLKGLPDAKISGVPAGSIDESIDILEKNDPQFPSHIHKLAQLSIKDPKKFTFLIGMLDQMKI